MKINAMVIHDPNGPYRLEEVELDEPGEGEVLVRIVATGICMTDEAARAQHVPTPLPLVPGHEGAGVVEKVGPGVTDLAVGDHVGITYAYDGSCPACEHGEPFYCENFNAINFGGTAAKGGTRLHQNGADVSMFFGQSSFATHSVVSAASCAKVDPDVDLGLVAPLGCGIQTGAGMVLNVAQAGPDTQVAVFGIGAVGMSAVMGANIAGCKTIIAVGGNERSLALARELGATHTINRREVDDIAGAILEITGGGVNVAIDTSGHAPMVKAALASVKYRGLFLPVGGTVLDGLDLGMEVIFPMRTIRGTSEGESHPKTFIPQLVEWCKEGRFPVDRILSFYDFDQIDTALADSREGKIIKAVLRVSEQ